MLSDPTINYLEEWHTLISDLCWFPDWRNKPQIQAYFTDAFEVLYGGAAGGGKSDLLLGLARTMQKRSLLLRREFPDLERSLISRSIEFYGSRQNYNATKHTWHIDGRRIEFGQMERIGTPQMPGDEAQYASAPYDFIGFDQLEQFPEYAYEFMMSRARSAEGHRVRMVSSANPAGEHIAWIMKRWRAWLIDKTARPGELRYYKRNEKGEDVEASPDDPMALSRTYIPAGLKDNPYLGDDYERTLASLPEPLRSALLNGDWEASLTDDAYQVIPRAWLRAAMNRWTQECPYPDLPLVVGQDIARGGADKTVLSRRRGMWFDQLEKHNGIETPDGASAADFLAIALAQGGTGLIDVIGVGASAYDQARNKHLTVIPVNFAEGSDATDRSGTLHFVNVRAACYWKFREALDPKSPVQLMLPPDPELEADLCALRWSSQTNGIKIESKEEIKKRLGRSPDCGDAVVMAWYNDAIAFEDAFAMGYDSSDFEFGYEA